MNSARFSSGFITLLFLSLFSIPDSMGQSFRNAQRVGASQSIPGEYGITELLFAHLTRFEMAEMEHKQANNRGYFGPGISEELKDFEKALIRGERVMDLVKPGLAGLDRRLSLHCDESGVILPAAAYLELGVSDAFAALSEAARNDEIDPTDCDIGGGCAYADEDVRSIFMQHLGRPMQAQEFRDSFLQRHPNLEGQYQSLCHSLRRLEEACPFVTDWADAMINAGRGECFSSSVIGNNPDLKTVKKCQNPANWPKPYGFRRNKLSDIVARAKRDASPALDFLESHFDLGFMCTRSEPHMWARVRGLYSPNQNIHRQVTENRPTGVVDIVRPDSNSDFRNAVFYGSRVYRSARSIDSVDVIEHSLRNAHYGY